MKRDHMESLLRYSLIYAKQEITVPMVEVLESWEL